MLEIDVPKILDEVQALAWLSSETRLELAKLAKLQLYESREIVFQGLEKSEQIYIVVSGNLQVLRYAETGEQLVNVLYERGVFDIGFLYDRSLGYESIVVASMPSLLLSIPVSEVQQVIMDSKDDQGIFNILKEYYDAYTFVKSSTTFGDQLQPRFLVEFVSAFEKKNYQSDSFVFRQGDDPDGYYICISGLLKVIVEVNGKVVFTTELKPGDYFGELALTTDSKRSASIQAIEETECYFLSRQVFDDLVKKETQLLEGFKILAKLAYG